jgi:hypothetical protein
MFIDMARDAVDLAELTITVRAPAFTAAANGGRKFSRRAYSGM